MFSFHGFTPPPEILDVVRQGTASSFCLFTHQNVQSPAQVRQLTDALRQAAREGGQLPPLIGIDQEGGQLIAIGAGATELPGNMALGATRSRELAAKAGYVLGRELLAMGINLDFAPAMDVNINPDNPVIGIRAFGDTPEQVGLLGAALIRAMQAEGVMASAKHFPGHGDTSIDSHRAVPVNAHPMSRLNAVELLPFRMAIDAGVGSILTAHVVFSALDDQLPATQSAAVLTGLLREDMGYDGLIITDAMDMYAVSHVGNVEGVRLALEAGVDLALLGHIPDQLAIPAQLDFPVNLSALQRIERARRAIPAFLPDINVVGCDEHGQIAQEIADRSITLVRDNGRLPIRSESREQIAVITVTPIDLTPADTSSMVDVSLAQAIQRRHPNVRALQLPYNASSGELRAVLEAAADADVVVLGTINAANDPSQVQLVEALQQRGQQPMVVSLRTPYDIGAFPSINTYLCAYSIRAVTCEAVAKVLFGEIAPTGVLPCSIPGIAQSGMVV
jgi:beta-N-acetylhexosaminidase